MRWGDERSGGWLNNKQLIIIISSQVEQCALTGANHPQVSGVNGIESTSI